MATQIINITSKPFPMRIVHMTTQIIDMTSKAFSNLYNLHEKQTRQCKYHKHALQNLWKLVVASRMPFWSILGGPLECRKTQKTAVGHKFYDRFGGHFLEKSENGIPPKSIDTEKVPNNDAKRFQHDAKVDAKINACSYFSKTGETFQIICFII